MGHWAFPVSTALIPTGAAKEPPGQLLCGEGYNSQDLSLTPDTVSYRKTGSGTRMYHRGRSLIRELSGGSSDIPRFEVELETPEDETRATFNDFLSPSDDRRGRLMVNTTGLSPRMRIPRDSFGSAGSGSSRHSSPNRARSHTRSIISHASDEVEGVSFMENLVGDEDLIELKEDMKSAIRGGETHAGTWLAPVISKSRNASATSIEQDGIELQPIKSTDEVTVNRDPSITETSHGARPNTVEGAFQQITERIRHGDRWGYKRRQSTDLEEGPAVDPFDTSPRPPLRLYGNSLRFFTPSNKLRRVLASLLLHNWIDHVLALLLNLQTGLLCYRQWNPAVLHGDQDSRSNWVDWLLAATNIFYTFEIVAKAIAWGMWDDSEMHNSMNAEYRSLRDIIKLGRVKDFFLNKKDRTIDLKLAPLKHSVTFGSVMSSGLPIPRAYLRSSWNRVDFVSTCAFWINSLLSIGRFNSKHHISIFRALDSLRILRLTAMTERIGLILKSIKVGAPQLMDVILFFAYFWTFFAIIGVQSFKSSLRRYCVWTNPNDSTDTWQSSQYCGGSWIERSDGSLGKRPYIMLNGAVGPRIKGYTCPVNSQCIELDNANQNTFGYDNILNSLQMTFVIMSANTFTDIMYDIVDSESLAASIYFIAGLFVLYLWMANLLVAVINSSFKVARETDVKFRKSRDNAKDDFELQIRFPKANWVNRAYSKVQRVFDALPGFSVGFACTVSADRPPEYAFYLYKIQSVFTLVFLIEILWRMACYYPKPKLFFKSARNNWDLWLVFLPGVMAIPSNYASMGRVYDWFTIFQMARFYRTVLLTPWVRKLWAKVWRSIRLILDLSLFYFLLLCVSSIIMSRLLEGYATPTENPDFLFPMNTLPNVILALFVVTTTENWTEMMYNMESVAPNKISILFLVCLIFIWFVLSNTVVFNLFIGIIGESFEASETVKRREQVKKFVLVDFPRKLKSIAGGSVMNDLRTRVFRTDDDQFRDLEVEKLLLNGAAVEEFLKDELNGNEEISDQDREFMYESRSPFIRYFQKQYKSVVRLGLIHRVIGYLFWDSPKNRNPFFKDFKKSIGLESYATLHMSYQTESQKVDDERRKFIKDNPNFNRSLYLMMPAQPLRRLCQRIVKPSVGKRYDGVEPNVYANRIFNGIIVIGTFVLIVTACITTPIYQKMYLRTTWNWTSEIEMSFAILFLVELLLKICADGLLFTPNGYLQSSWNWVDLVVVISIWINVFALMRDDQSLSRSVSGLKALRALRFLAISETSRSIFHNVMIAGFWKILTAAGLSLTLIVPFAAWGLTLFSNRLGVCNDGNGYDGCITEYVAEVFNWQIMAPKVYSSPQLELNHFPSALLTLYEILSLEGWVDLMQNMVNSTGVGTAPSYFASPENAIFPVLFTLVGIVFSLTLFISVIISNYARLSGSAFLTLQQRSWNEVTKLLSQATPRQRPTRTNLSSFRQFCFQYSVERPQYVTGGLQVFLWIHILAILLEKYPSSSALDEFRYTIYMVSSTVLLLSSLLRLGALGVVKFFTVRWNTYEFIVYLGAFGTSAASFFVSRNTIFANINKLFLVGIFTVLIHMSNRLSHLLKIASASLPSLLSLVFTWLVMFIVFSILLNQIFGLTRIGPNTTGNMNFRTVPKTLVLLFRNSFGEAWNYTMRDFAVETPYCTDSGDFNSSDCGNQRYAYLIFVLWNIISMYIFVNMCISLIFENFSYVYTDNNRSVVLTREEIRNFKSTWALFDPKGTGFIELNQLSEFLYGLDGYFSFKVFEGKWTVSELKKAFIGSPRFNGDPYNVDVDLDGLNRMLNTLDVAKVRERRLKHEMFIEEAKFNMERYSEVGISFQRMIILIPLYMRFDENNCLQLTGFLDRIVVSKKVAERLRYRGRLDTLKMIVPRYFFLKRRGSVFTPLGVNNFDEDLDFESPFSPQVNDRSRPMSFGKSLDESYWSPPKQKQEDSWSDKDRDVMMELSSVAGDLRNSLWRDELADVGDDLNNVLRSRDMDSDSDSVDVVHEELGFVLDRKGNRKIT